MKDKISKAKQKDNKFEELLKLVKESFIYSDVENLSFERPPVAALISLDCSATNTGFMMSAINLHEKNELLSLVPVEEDVNKWNKTQTVKSKNQSKNDRFCTYPYANSRMVDFRANIWWTYHNSVKQFLKKYNMTEEEFNHPKFPKFVAAESVFLQRLNVAIPLARFQNVALSIFIASGYIPFEHDNQSAKHLIGAGKTKENVIGLINEMYDLEIPEEEKYSHVADAILIGHYHNYLVNKVIFK